MSARSPFLMEVLSRYVAGFFPLYDPWGRFYWERLVLRALLPVNEVTAGRAKRMSRRALATGKKWFEFRYNTSLTEIIAILQDEAVKENSWVREDVVRIYLALQAVGMMRTVEAWHEGKLVGGLVGIVLPGTFIAETMYGLVPGASKACLCRLILDCQAAGFEMIDVQTPHHLDEFGEPRAEDGTTAHPCIRLGEQHLHIAEYLKAFVAAWRRAFGGGLEQWVAAARAVRTGDARGVPATDLESARRFLTVPVAG